MASLKTQKCRCCEGSGKELDHKSIGPMMKQRRLKAGLTQGEVALRMGISGAYVCDLERGTRNWRDELIAKYGKALE
jgi:transcriptional regulator with XRE-family HTH domain